MPHKEESLHLQVDESKQRDIGKKRARISPDAMDYLHVAPGDVIEIVGKKTSSAIVWPVDEDEKNPDIINIDGQMRKNVGVSVNDAVQVKKVETKTAKTVVLVPINDVVTVDKEFTDFVKNRLKGLPLSDDDEISVMILGNSMEFKINKITPKGVVKINRSSNLTILDETPSDRKVHITYEEVGGLRTVIKSMREIVELPLKHPELFSRLGVEPHSGVLLYGPPGCGKTLLAKVLATESDANMYSINGPEIMNKYYGETEARLREIFKEAKDNSPSIIFIDEIDAIAPKREEVFGDVEKRVVAQLLALMDGLTDRGNVVVLGATNRPDSVDPALRRPGRFDRELEISVPNIDGRIEILQIHTRGMPIGKDVDLEKLASELHGYTGADIKSLCRESAIKAIRRYLPKIDLENKRIPSKILQSMEIQLCDLSDAMHEIVPTAMREFYVERAKILWKDVGGLSYAKKVLEDNIITSINNPNKFSKMGIRPPKGVLLYGPPGCGKTLLARALAAECGTNMILVRGQDILSKWVGESEKAIREIFRKARSSAPCIIIFDEMDSLVKFKTAEEGRQNDTILTQILTEMEESGAAKIGVVGITSRPDLVDNSMLRPGRLDIVLYIEAPDEKSRLEIIRILTKQMPLVSDVDLNEIAVATQNYSGADIESLCREAAVNAMQNNHAKISSNDFAEGLKKVKPSITKDVEQWYSSIKDEVSKIIPKSTDKIFYG
jgi:transitional endoplasmic reticulum ATPase